MNESLIPLAEVFSGDPVNPDRVLPCPDELVLDLSGRDRKLRLARLIKQTHEIIDEAIEVLGRAKRIEKTAVLFSGGNDSTVLTHVVKERVDCAVHINTGIGIPETAAFVRRTCESLQLPLIEGYPSRPYRDLVVGKGFPGPSVHHIMYHYLKQESLDSVRRSFINGDRSATVHFIAGRRRSESRRRKNIPFYDRNHGAIFTDAIAMWTKPDLVVYRQFNPDVPFNSVADKLGKSGECLCGAFASRRELELIRFHYPEVAEQIESLEREIADDPGIPAHKKQWAHGLGSSDVRTAGVMCSGCESLFEEEDL